MPSKHKKCKDELKVRKLDACKIKAKKIEVDLICADKIYGDVDPGPTGPKGPTGPTGRLGPTGPTGSAAPEPCYDHEFSFGAINMYKTNSQGVITLVQDVIPLNGHSIIAWRFVNHEENHLNWQLQFPKDIDTSTVVKIHLHFYVKFVSTNDPMTIILETVTANNCNNFTNLTIYDEDIELPCGQTSDVFFSHDICINPLQFNMVNNSFHQFVLQIGTDDPSRETFVLASKFHYKKLQNCNSLCEIIED